MSTKFFLVTMVLLAFLSGNAFCGSEPGVLPVTIVYFRGDFTGRTLWLQWQTATEIECYGYYIERADSALNWTQLGFVQGHGTSNSTNDYSFSDTTLSVSGKYYYRLNQMDLNGHSDYSKTIDFIYSNANSVSDKIDRIPDGFILKQNYPNPFNPSTNVEFEIPEEGAVSLILYDVSGREVKRLIENRRLSTGVHVYSLDAADMATGPYIIRLLFGGKSLSRKVLLLK